MLIKPNLIDIPQFSMNWFKMSKYMCNEIIEIRCFFWNTRKKWKLVNAP